MPKKTKKVASRKTQRKSQAPETDSTYILKLVMYLIIGSLWVKITNIDHQQLPIPIGFIIGMIFAIHDHFQIDRKIEFALLLVAMFIGFWLPVGVFVSM